MVLEAAGSVGAGTGLADAAAGAVVLPSSVALGDAVPAFASQFADYPVLYIDGIIRDGEQHLSAVAAEEGARVAEYNQLKTEAEVAMSTEAQEDKLTSASRVAAKVKRITDLRDKLQVRLRELREARDYLQRHNRFAPMDRDLEQFGKAGQNGPTVAVRLKYGRIMADIMKIGRDGFPGGESSQVGADHRDGEPTVGSKRRK